MIENAIMLVPSRKGWRFAAHVPNCIELAAADIGVFKQGGVDVYTTCGRNLLHAEAQYYASKGWSVIHNTAADTYELVLHDQKAAATLAFKQL